MQRDTKHGDAKNLLPSDAPVITTSHGPYTLLTFRIFTDNYLYAIKVSKPQGPDELIVIDPGLAAPIISYLDSHSCILRAILLTHSHQDHIGGVADLQAYGHQHARKQRPFQIFGHKKDPHIPDQAQHVTKGTTFSIDSLKIKVIHVPGHTPYHVAFFLPLPQWLFAGDVLFTMGCGLVQDNNFKDARQSLDKICTLPETTVYFPAHEYSLRNTRFLMTLQPKSDYANTLQAFQDKYQNDFNHRKRPLITLAEEKKLNLFLNPRLRSSLSFLQKILCNEKSDLVFFEKLYHIKYS